MKPVWGQTAPPKHENGGKKRPQNHKVGAESAPTQIRTEKVWRQKVPSKCKSGGKKCHQNCKVTAKSASAQISEKKLWWRKMPSKWKSGGGKCHQTSKVMAKSATTFKSGGTLATTYHIQGAGAPAKTKNYVNADAFIFFREKARPFPHLAKPVNTTNFMLAWK